MRSFVIIFSIIVSSVLSSTIAWSTCNVSWLARCSNYCLALGRRLDLCLMDSTIPATPLVRAIPIVPFVRAVPLVNTTPFGHTITINTTPVVRNNAFVRTRTAFANRRVLGVKNTTFRNSAFLGRRNYGINHLGVGAIRQRTGVRTSIGARRALGTHRVVHARRRAFLQTESKIAIWRWSNHVNCRCGL